MPTETPDALIEVLNKDREYHSRHPQEVFTKMLYTLGASLTTVIVAIYLAGKDSHDIFKQYIEKVNVPLVGVLLLVGFISIVFGLAEHYTLHIQQRKRIEAALNDILTDPGQFDYAGEIMAIDTLRYSDANR